MPREPRNRRNPGAQKPGDPAADEAEEMGAQQEAKVDPCAKVAESGKRQAVIGECGRANLTGLVLGCIKAKFCKKICVGKLSPRSTQCTPLHSSAISFLNDFLAKFCQNLQNSATVLKNFANFGKF